MKINYNLLAIYFLVITASTALAQQNFVTNPGFEIQNGCPSEGDVSSAPPWNSPNQGTPDLFNSTCSSQNINARTGIGSAGLITYGENVANQREYIQVALDTPLIPAQNYCVSMWVKYSGGRYATNRLGMHLSTTEISETASGVLALNPIVENPPTEILGDTVNWVEISGHIDAKGGESYLLIGNFYEDAFTTTTVVDSNSSIMRAYYQIDDISIKYCQVGVHEHSLESQLKVFPTLADKEINIHFPKSQKIDRVTLTNVAGQQVATLEKIDNGSGEIILHTFSHPAGVYILRVDSGDETVTRKVMLAR